MEFNEVLNARRSIRKYKPDEVTDSQIAALLEAARLAPSGFNVQPWRFVAVKDRDTRKMLAGATGSAFVADAPVVIVCCMDMTAFASFGSRLQELVGAGAFTEERLALYTSEEFVKGMDMSEQWLKANLSMYVAIAATHLMLKAADLGLGSCWVGHFDEEKVKHIAGLDGRYGVTAMITIGYASQNPTARPRLPINELLLRTI